MYNSSCCFWQQLLVKAIVTAEKGTAYTLADAVMAAAAWGGYNNRWEEQEIQQLLFLAAAAFGRLYIVTAEKGRAYTIAAAVFWQEVLGKAIIIYSWEEHEIQQLLGKAKLKEEHKAAAFLEGSSNSWQEELQITITNKIKLDC